MTHTANTNLTALPAALVLPDGPRAVLAFIALAAAPVPQAIRFLDGIIDIDLRSIADLHVWVRLLGISDKVRTQPYLSSTEGRLTLASATGRVTATWHVGLHASDPATPFDALDDETRARLGEIVQCEGCGAL